MLTKTPSWTTTDGKVHTSYITGLKHELTALFAKAADTSVIARNIVDSLNPDSIDTVVKLLNLIKAEMKDPSCFEVREIPKLPVAGIDDLPENESLGVVGETPVEPQPAKTEAETDQVGEGAKDLNQTFDLGTNTITSDAAVFTDPCFHDVKEAA